MQMNESGFGPVAFATILVTLIILLIYMYYDEVKENFSPYASILIPQMFRSDAQFDNHLSKHEKPMIPF